MKFGVRLPHFKQVAMDPATTGRNIIRVASRAEELGFHSVIVGDHIVPSSDTGDQFGSVWYEAMVTLSFAAAATSTIRLGTAILVTPYRHPVLLGKMLSTLDALSGGRVDAGFGTGWLESEFNALGLSSVFAERGRVTDESLARMRAMWRGEGIGTQTESGQEYMVAPLPVQPAGIPIWIGGNSKRAARRVVELGDGWLTVRPTYEEFGAGVAYLRSLCEEAGRPLSSVGLAIEHPLVLSKAPMRDVPCLGDSERIIEQLKRFADLGAEVCFFDMFYSAPENEHVGVEQMLDEMQLFAEEVAPHFQPARTSSLIES
jgi:probable F420-dependent oxidoreductase